MSFARSTLVVGIAVACLGLASCGGGGGGGGGDAGLGGWWYIEVRLAGSADPFLPFMVIQMAEQNGNVWANGTELVRNGSNLHAEDPSASDPDRTVIDLNVQADGSLAGTFVEYKSGSAEPMQDMQATRTTAPAGTFTIAPGSTVEGQPVSLASTTAYGMVEDDVGEMDFAIFHSVPFERETSLYVSSAPAPLVSGTTYVVGGGAGQVNVELRVDDQGDDATAGSVTVTTVTTERITGTFDLTLGSSAATGTFDVPIRVVRSK